MLAEIDSEGEVSVYYTIGADLISQERGGKKYTYLYDGHGSVTALSDESGKITDTYSYDAFGNLLESKGRTANNYRYCGEQFDSTTGLYYLRARYMDTSTGRFISQDSYQGSVYDPVSLHKHLYANSNPVTYSDPSGYLSLAGEIATVACVCIIATATVSLAMNIFRNLVNTFRENDIFKNDRISFWDNSSSNTVPIISYAQFFLFYMVTNAIAGVVEQVYEDEDEDEKTTDMAPSKKDKRDDGKIYYHATSVYNAAIILATNCLYGGRMEGGCVFAWEIKPPKRIVKRSGAAYCEALVEFKTLAAFEPDNGIEDAKILKYRPVKSVFAGPIHLTSSRIVPFPLL